MHANTPAGYALPTPAEVAELADLATVQRLATTRTAAELAAWLVEMESPTHPGWRLPAHMRRSLSNLRAALTVLGLAETSTVEGLDVSAAVLTERGPFLAADVRRTAEHMAQVFRMAAERARGRASMPLYNAA